MKSERKLKEALAEWLGMTIDDYYGNCDYIVLHTFALKQMPEEFQRRFVAMVQEYEDTFDMTGFPEEFKVAVRNKKGQFQIDEMIKNKPKLKRKMLTKDR